MYRPLIFGTLLLVAQVSTPQCDSSSAPSGTATTTTPGATPNVVPVTVNGGPTNQSLNQMFTSVTICVPGTSNCQTIGQILVDTGSSGLRILSSSVTLPLPQQTNSAGAPVVECLAFLDSITWGPVQTADVKLAGEQASSIPIQIIGTDKFPSIPSGCSAQGDPEETVTDLAANGILGVGLAQFDCGSDCTFTGPSNSGMYYGCPSPSSCQVTVEPLANQVQNPVARFASDNNGVVIQLPAVSVGGAPSVSGSLIFGIGTQADNALGSAKVLTTDGSGQFTTTFNNKAYPKSFIDSGSNGIFFLDPATSGLPACRLSKGFYCPTTVRVLSATNAGANGVTSPVSFNAGNVDTLSAVNAVMVEATGEQAGSFDWGLPFFYGRTVFTAIAGRSTPGGTGPFWAY